MPQRCTSCLLQRYPSRLILPWLKLTTLSFLRLYNSLETKDTFEILTDNGTFLENLLQIYISIISSFLVTCCLVPFFWRGYSSIFSRIVLNSQPRNWYRIERLVSDRTVYNVTQDTDMFSRPFTVTTFSTMFSERHWAPLTVTELPENKMSGTQ